MKRLDALEETVIGVEFPTLPDAFVKAPPGFMVFRGIQVVNLRNEKLSALTGLFHERGVAGGKPQGSDGL